MPLLIAETSTRRLQAFAASDPDMLVWWGSKVECVSALARLERDTALAPQAAVRAFGRLEQLAADWHEIDPSDILREAAARFLRVHAFIAAEQRPASLEMLTLDERLAGAAQKEGFSVIDIAADRPRVRG